MRIAMALPIVAILCGCGSSPPVRYHALSGAPAQVAESKEAGATLLVELLPVALPERLRRTNIVLTGENGETDVLDGERWAGPLADEIRQVVDDALWHRLGAVDVYAAPVPLSAGGLPEYRLALRVERFEAVPGHQSTVEASWTFRVLPKGDPSVCRASFVAPLPGRTADAAAASLADGARRMAAAVAASLERARSGGRDPCGGGA